MKRTLKAWDHAELDALRDMRAEGISIPYCARALDRSDGSVRNMCRRLQLEAIARAAKDAEINFRLTEAERDHIRLAAHKARHSLSSFVRKAAVREAAAILGNDR